MQYSISQTRGRIRKLGGQEACHDVSLTFIWLVISLFSFLFNLLISFTKISMNFGSEKPETYSHVDMSRTIEKTGFDSWYRQDIFLSPKRPHWLWSP
jgi:hypothetical protein